MSLLILPYASTRDRTLPSPTLYNSQLYLTDPAGIFSEWKANAIGGRNEKAVNEYLEKNWTAAMTEDDSVRTTIKALLEVVDSGAKNMEIAIMRKGEAVSMMSEEQLTTIIADIEREAEEAKAKTTADTNAE